MRILLPVLLFFLFPAICMASDSSNGGDGSGGDIEKSDFVDNMLNRQFSDLVNERAGLEPMKTIPIDNKSTNASIDGRIVVALALLGGVIILVLWRRGRESRPREKDA